MKVVALKPDSRAVPQVVFRAMLPSDLDEVVRIEADSFSQPWSRYAFRECLQFGFHCWVCEIGGDVGGYAILSVEGREAHLLNLCIRREYRGMGFGRKFLTHLVEECRRKGARSIRLEVRPSNQVALNLYRSMGFRQIGRAPGYYDDGLTREDALLLRLEWD